MMITLRITMIHNAVPQAKTQLLALITAIAVTIGVSMSLFDSYFEKCHFWRETGSGILVLWSSRGRENLMCKDFCKDNKLYESHG